MNTSKYNWALYIGLLALLALAGAAAAYAVQAAPTDEQVVHHVSLVDGQAFPNELIVKVGEQVQFNSKDGKAHEISSGKGNDYGEEHGHVEGGLASGYFEADEAYLVSFNEPGTYYFHDHFDANAYITVLAYTPESI